MFGQHVHIGVPNGDEALWLLHALSRYVPHFIALSASSPFVQGVDTGFHSARLNSVFAFPLSGRAPFVLSWDGFGEFFKKMTSTGVVQSMKDFYWDIRPKPEYGTIELRVCPSRLWSSIASARAWLSAAPPGAAGTIRRTGFSGYSARAACRGARTPIKSAAAKLGIRYFKATSTVE